MPVTQQKNLVLILAQQLASNVATPMFLLDPRGMLVYYNEPAAELIGQPFAEVGEMDARDWGARFDPKALDGSDLDLQAMPPALALTEQKPGHQIITAVDGSGQRRRVAITAFPLFARADEFVGVITIFWENHQGQGG
jgi:PAS domain-containing protein